MNTGQCKKQILASLDSSPCGAVFRYSNYVDPTPHQKFVICHNKEASILCVVSATSQNLSSFLYSTGIGESIMTLDGSRYPLLTKTTYVECSKIEEILIEELVAKCEAGKMEILQRMDDLLLQEIQKTAFESKSTNNKQIKRLRRCIESCDLKKP